MTSPDLCPNQDKAEALPFVDRTCENVGQGVAHAGDLPPFVARVVGKLLRLAAERPGVVRLIELWIDDRLKRAC